MNTKPHDNSDIIDKLNLSKRTKKVLEKISEPLSNLTKQDLLIKYKIGQKSLNELSEELGKINISLKTVS